MPVSKEAGELIAKARPHCIKAVDYDAKKKPNDAVPEYMKGIEYLLSALKLLDDQDQRDKLTEQIENYMNRAEALRGETKVNRKISAGSTGHGYDRIFAKCLDAKLKSVRVEDAYIREHHQILNFVRFCELLASNCDNIKRISLVTSPESRQNVANFADLKRSLIERGIMLHVVYKEDLHDRQIYFDNGWTVKIGRGLDYFRPPKSRFAIGALDMNLRPCHETTIDIIRHA